MARSAPSVDRDARGHRGVSLATALSRRAHEQASGTFRLESSPLARPVASPGSSLRATHRRSERDRFESGLNPSAASTRTPPSTTKQPPAVAGLAGAEFEVRFMTSLSYGGRSAHGRVGQRTAVEDRLSRLRGRVPSWAHRDGRSSWAQSRASSCAGSVPGGFLPEGRSRSARSSSSAAVASPPLCLPVCGSTDLAGRKRDVSRTNPRGAVGAPDVCATRRV